jgi:hypothetical protein
VGCYAGGLSKFCHICVFDMWKGLIVVIRWKKFNKNYLFVIQENYQYNLQISFNFNFIVVMSFTWPQLFSRMKSCQHVFIVTFTLYWVSTAL